MRFLSLLVLCFSLQVAAAPVEQDRYFFYRATKDGVAIYLLGSMHMGRPSDPD